MESHAREKDDRKSADALLEALRELVDHLARRAAERDYGALPRKLSA